jgi:hypothetical protein
VYSNPCGTRKDSALAFVLGVIATKSEALLASFVFSLDLCRGVAEVSSLRFREEESLSASFLPVLGVADVGSSALVAFGVEINGFKARGGTGLEVPFKSFCLLSSPSAFNFDKSKLGSATFGGEGTGFFLSILVCGKAGKCL